MIDARLFGEVFVTLTVIMDPLGTVPIFLGLTAGRPVAARRRLAWQAVVVAGLVIATFAVFGQQILDYLGITLPALQGAGGLLLVLVALELLRGGASDPEEVPDVNVALVPLGTPLLAGPGAIAATIVFVRSAQGASEYVAIGLGLVAVHVVLWLALRYSVGVLRLVREAGIHLITRILGLLLSAIAVQLLADSVRAFVRAG
ncbi:MAG: multiple antibiotic resistance protein [Frankiaceae bacterium]|nr:multiple antibiotic resistance protein [Frankiaceae bacterium]